MTSLGTLLIQRLDAALGNAISRQTGLVNTSRDFISQPAEPTRPGTIDPSTIRDPRESVDRVIDQSRQRTRTGANRAITEARPTDTARAGRPAPGPSAQTTLGAAARIILTLLADYTPGSAKVAGRRPLIATPPAAQAGRPAETQLARNLNQAIRTSGLFYESHLKSLTQGQYRLSAIMREPQSRLLPQPTQTRVLHTPLAASTPQLPPHMLAARASSDMPGTAGPPATPAGTAEAATQGAQRPAATYPAFPTAQAPPGTPAGGPTASADAPRSSTGPGASAASSGAPSPGAQAAGQAASQLTPGVDPATHPLVRQQLEILADQTIQWRGEAWPDAPMDWRIERHGPDHRAPASHDTDTEETWQSHIRLQLPQLGEVRASIRLDGPHVRLALQAEQPASAALFNQEAAQLEAQLSARQLQLAALHIDTLSTEP